MKNKDNVEIKVGQEWKLNNGWMVETLAFHDGGCLCYIPELEVNCYRNYASTCFCTLIGCVHCGAGDDAHHSFGCPGDMHPDKVPEIVHCMLEEKTCDTIEGKFTSVASEVTCPACKDLISDPDQPWLPLPDGDRLWTEDEMELYPQTLQTKYWNDSEKIWKKTQSWGKQCLMHIKYAVPTDFKFEEPEPVEPEKPKFKLFEIELTQFQAETKSKPTHSLEVPCVVEEYRIFGYTDNEHWVEGTIAIQKHRGNIDCVQPYDARSCDHTGNRKYAIGKLEA